MRNQPKHLRDHWNSPVTDYNVLSDETCKLLFDQSKLYFEEASQESQEVTQRSFRLLFFFIPAVAAVIGFCISNRDKLRALKVFDYLLLAAMIGCVVLCIYLLFKLTGPKPFYYRGTKPEEMMRPEIFKLIEPLQIQRALFISEVERYQIKIEQMESWNLERIKMYTEVVYAFNILMGLRSILLIRTILFRS